MGKAAFIAVFAFALGVLVRDVAQDYAKPDPVCERAKKDAKVYSAWLVHLLNRDTMHLDGAVVSCRVRHPKET